MPEGVPRSFRMDMMTRYTTKPLHGTSYKLNRWGFYFVIPALICFCIFSYFPMLNTFFISMTNYDLITPKEFVGLKNYIDLLSDDLFHQSIGVTTVYVFGSTILTLILSLGLAKFMDWDFNMKGVYRGLFFLPSVLDLVVVAILARMILMPNGLLFSLTKLFSPRPVYWLTDKNLALFSVIMVRLWRTTGYFMVFFLVGLKGIDSTYYEVSDIDGANAFQKFWRITWPLLKPTTVMVIITSFINAIRDFTVPFIMLQGGPAGSTTSLSILIYLNGFDFLKMGKASAISTLMFIVIMVITLIQLRVFRTEE